MAFIAETCAAKQAKCFISFLRFQHLDFMYNALKSREYGMKPALVCDFVRADLIHKMESSPIFFELAHTAAVRSLDVDPIDHRYLLSAGNDGGFGLWDLDARGKPLSFLSRGATGHKYAISGINWYHQDNGMFFTASFDQTVGIWDTNELRCIHRYKCPGKIYQSIQKHELIVFAHEGGLSMGDLRSGKQTQALIGHRGAVYSAAWSPQPYCLASGGADGKLLLWDIRRAGPRPEQFDQHNVKGNPAAHYGSVTGVRWLPDGHHLLSTGEDGRIRQWTTGGQNLIVSYPAISSPGLGTNSNFAVSADGRWLFHPSNREIWLIDIHTGALIKSLRGHFDRCLCVALRPGWDQAFSGGAEMQIFAWDSEARRDSAVAPPSDPEDNWD